MRFQDRHEAGRLLGRVLATRYGGGRGEVGHDGGQVVVLALPRGGVPVGYEVARALGAPLDVFVVRKIGVPGHEELALGAIASGGVRVLNEELVERLDISEELIDRLTAVEQRELERREQAYRGDGERQPLDVAGRTVILVDDGVATGATMRAAVAALRPGVGRLVVAVPVGAPSTVATLRQEADEVVTLATPPMFLAVGYHYEDFRQLSDEDVRWLLARAHERYENERREGRARADLSART